jgi:ParB family chromosome partitioning protein
LKSAILGAIASNMTTTMDKKRALGRGLESLIPAARQTAPVVREVVREVPGEGVQEIPIDEIEPSPYQPRRHNEQEKLQELAASITVSGVMQPIVVREISAGIVRFSADADLDAPESAIFSGQPRPPIDAARVKYQLIAGERRWLASRLAGKETIPAIIRRVSNEQAAELSLIENLQREDLNPMEMAFAFARLSSDFGLTQEQIAARTGKDRATVANHMRLLKLPPDAQGYLAMGKLSFGHAKVLMGLPDDAIGAVLLKVVRDGLSVRQTEELAKRHTWDRPKPAEGSAPEPKWRDPNVKDAERQLMASLGTKVSIVDKGGRGKVVIEYKTLEDFDRIIEALGSRQ